MAGERKKGIPIADGRRTIHDDQPPHIDPYGLAQIESLCGRLQTLWAEEDNPIHKQNLEGMMKYAEDIVDRYT